MTTYTPDEHVTEDTELNFHDLYRGNIDSRSKSAIVGWVHLTDDEHTPVSVSLFINGQKIETSKANLYRQDLDANGISSCGFILDLPEIFHHTLDGYTDVCRLEVSDGNRSYLMGIGSFGKEELTLDLVGLDNSAASDLNSTCIAESDEDEEVSEQMLDAHDLQTTDGTAEEACSSHESECVSAENFECGVEEDIVQVEPVSDSDEVEQPLEHVVDIQELFCEYFHGCVDNVNTKSIQGWVTSKRKSSEPVAVMLMINGRYCARVQANNYRQDVDEAGYADGNCGFEFDLSDYELSDSDLFDTDVIIEVGSEETLAVMHLDRMPSVFGSISDMSKKDLIGAFDQFHFGSQKSEELEKGTSKYSPSGFANGVIKSLYRTNEKATGYSAADIPNLSPYLVYTRDRLNKHKEYEYENDPRAAVDLLLWYLEEYSVNRRPYKVPLSNAEINYCNDLVNFPGARNSFSRLHYYMLLKDNPELEIIRVLNDDQEYCSVIYQWVTETCERLNIKDICVPDEYVEILSSVPAYSRGIDFPLSKYFELKYANSTIGSGFNLNIPTHRGCLYLMSIKSNL